MVTMIGGYKLEGDVGQAWIIFSGASDEKGYIYIYDRSL